MRPRKFSTSLSTTIPRRTRRRSTRTSFRPIGGSMMLTQNISGLNHSAEEWVVGDVHTNGIESVWSLLKRSIIGSYHKVSIKHLDAYLDELEHRFNNRKNEYIFRDTLTKLVNAAKLPYSELVKAA